MSPNVHTDCILWERGEERGGEQTRHLRRNLIAPLQGKCLSLFGHNSIFIRHKHAAIKKTHRHYHTFSQGSAQSSVAYSHTSPGTQKAARLLCHETPVKWPTYHQHIINTYINVRTVWHSPPLFVPLQIDTAPFLISTQCK